MRQQHADLYLKTREEEIRKAEAEAALERKSIEAQTAARMKMIDAQGDAEVLKIKAAAEAEAYRLQAQAEAQEMQMKGYTYQQETARQVSLSATKLSFLNSPTKRRPTGGLCCVNTARKRMKTAAARWIPCWHRIRTGI